MVFHGRVFESLFFFFCSPRLDYSDLHLSAVLPLTHSRKRYFIFPALGWFQRPQSKKLYFMAFPSILSSASLHSPLIPPIFFCLFFHNPWPPLPATPLFGLVLLSCLPFRDPRFPPLLGRFSDPGSDSDAISLPWPLSPTVVSL